MRLMLRRSDFHTGLFMLRSQSFAFGCTPSHAAHGRFARRCVPVSTQALGGHDSWLHHSVRAATNPAEGTLTALLYYLHEHAQDRHEAIAAVVDVVHVCADDVKIIALHQPAHTNDFADSRLSYKCTSAPQRDGTPPACFDAATPTGSTGTRAQPWSSLQQSMQSFLTTARPLRPTALCARAAAAPGGLTGTHRVLKVPRVPPQRVLGQRVCKRDVDPVERVAIAVMHLCAN